MGKLTPTLTAVLLLLALAACAASCDSTTAAGRVTVGGTATIGAAQLSQFIRDSQSTQSAEDATVQARAMDMAVTASVATQTAVAVDQRAVAQATAAVITQQAVETVAARQATVQAGDDAMSTQRSVTLERAHIYATQQAQVAATGTAMVVQTQTTIRLVSEDTAAQRERLFNGAMAALIVTFTGLAIVGLLMGWRVFVANQNRRGMVQKFGIAGSQAVLMLEDGAGGYAILDPKTGFALGAQVRGGQLTTAPLTPEAMELIENAQKVQAIEAEHSPHAPAKPDPARLDKHSWHVGAIGASTEHITDPERVSIEHPSMPVATPPAPKIEPPKEKLHMVYIQGQSVSEADRDLVDLREFVERGALQGFTRTNWLGHAYQSGHDGTRERYDHLVDICTQAGVLEPAGRTWRLAVSQEQALAALNLENVALG